MGKDAVRELLKELEEDLRRHEVTARDLLSKVPTDADESHVRQHVRLRSKATTYGHAAELVADASTRLPEAKDDWGSFETLLLNLSVALSRDHGFDSVSFSAGSGMIFVWVRPRIDRPIPVSLESIRELGATEAFNRAIDAWRSRS